VEDGVGSGSRGPCPTRLVQLHALAVAPQPHVASGPTATLAPDPVLMRTTEVTSVTFTMTPSQDGVVLVRTADK
jgi:hypothetical protein